VGTVKRKRAVLRATFENFCDNLTLAVRQTINLADTLSILGLIDKDTAKNSNRELKGIQQLFATRRYQESDKILLFKAGSESPL
jgi:hypothetical protein